ncbi:DinB family protein [Fluviicola chungangensis]|uniref:DinB family protein n=1 Tax=Fluviicola chungangensis TaxID=2597671 RepID=A0A556N5T4_9FLAO|nr:DinB family protein [Fluviicola chungangensis]TSJ47550.1 DinB family protein [Fluviicola chungangensis]
MTTIISKLSFQLHSIAALLQGIDSIDYTLPIQEMGNATIGQHVRHTIEIAQSLVNGYISNEINYENRKRDPEIETSLNYAGKLCFELVSLIARTDKQLVLVEQNDAGEITHINSNYARELHFVLEHTIHHMALIKTGLQILKKDVTDPDFGVAYSTIQHRIKSCAQ